MTFKPGDRVRLSEAGRRYWGGTSICFDGTKSDIGTVAGFIPSGDRVGVNWDTGTKASHDPAYLEPADQQPPATEQHDPSCTIHDPLERGYPESGICTCGYGFALLRKGDESQMYSGERRDDWISVEDGVPMSRTDVLVCDTAWNGKVHLHVARLKGDRWLSVPGDYGCHPTHWRPLPALPQPPKEG